ncbi:hypothetical protein [Vibrio crassostreae]|uniref:hypothetical protein n=1 Tax=Vibrio crassostreae TaxID=246167 RepID=UPI001B313153|nr:hypothetical protein [Vibrio crassostreae]
MTKDQLEKLVILQAAEIAALKNELEGVKGLNQSNPYQHWQDRVIELKKAYPKMTQKRLAEEVGMAVVTVKKFLQKPETKSRLV